MKTNATINLLSLTLLVAMALGTSAGCGSEDPGPGQQSTDAPETGDAGILEYHIDNFDTGTGLAGCVGEFMTVAECLAVDGAFDLEFAEKLCIDGQEARCCIPDVLTNACPYECMGPVDCSLQGGDDLFLQGYQCPLIDGTFHCCQGATPLDQDTAPHMGVPFDPDLCPLTTAEIISSEDQPDKVASGLCIEMMDENSPFFCPQEDYNRIVNDIELIKEAYPVLKYDRTGQEYAAFAPTPTRPFAILCTAGVELKSCKGFPKEGWNDLLVDCFGGVYHDCQFEDELNGTCASSHLWFDVGVNTKRLLSLFEEHAKGLVPGSVCELDGVDGLSNPPNGFHITRVEPGGLWFWEVRATAVVENNKPNCDAQLKLFTLPGATDPSDVGETEKINASSPECPIPPFQNF